MKKSNSCEHEIDYNTITYEVYDGAGTRDGIFSKCEKCGSEIELGQMLIIKSRMR